jgi:hypothetical protein
LDSYFFLRQTPDVSPHIGREGKRLATLECTYPRYP